MCNLKLTQDLKFTWQIIQFLEKSTTSFKTKILFFQDPRFNSELTRIYVKEKRFT